MPLYLCQWIDNMQLDGTATQEEGRVHFISPINGRINRYFQASNGVPSAPGQEIRIRTRKDEADTESTWEPGVTIAASTAEGVMTTWEVPPLEKAAQVKAGEFFAIESDGGGTTAANGGIVVEIVE